MVTITPKYKSENRLKEL